MECVHREHEKAKMTMSLFNLFYFHKLSGTVCLSLYLITVKMGKVDSVTGERLVLNKAVAIF